MAYPPSNPYGDQSAYPTASSPEGQYGTSAAYPTAQPPSYGYQSAVPSQTTEDTLGSWLITFLLCSIPVVGLIYILMLAFGTTASPSKKNWALASLIWGVIVGIVYSILVFLFLLPVLNLLAEQAALQ